MTTDRLTSHPTATRWAAAALPVLVGALLALLRGTLAESTAAMVLVLTVVAAAATGDRVAGLAAALTAAGSFDFFLTEPYLSLSIHRTDDLELAVVLVIVGLAVTEIALWGRRQQAVALRREGYLTGLAHLLDLPPGTTATARGAAVADAIATALGADRCAWHPVPPRGDDPVLSADGSVTAGGRRLPVERTGLPPEGITAIVVAQDDEVLGHFAVTASTRVVRPTPEQLRVAVLLADSMLARRPSGR